MTEETFIYQSLIDPALCRRIIEDFERRGNHIQAHSIRGYTYLTSADLDVDLVTEYEFEMRQVLQEYNQKYLYSKETICSYEMYFPYNVQKYQPGNHYSVWHCENNGEPQYRKRHLSFITYLNDVTDAGETEFLYQNMKVTPKQGLTAIWPAGFTHTHRGIASPTQVKYIIQGWYTFFDTESFIENSLGLSDEDFFGKLEHLDRNVN